MLSHEQIQKIKTHLLDQLENFPEDQRKFMKHKILSMTNTEVEEFVKKNQLAHLEDSSSPAIQSQPNCIFCNILAGKIPSYKIYEDKDSIGILEINPLSKGHSLLVPRQHLEIEKLSENFLESANKIVEVIREKYNPIEIKVEKNNILGHSLVEIVPIYGDEKDRERAEPKELEKLKSELEIRQDHPSGKIKPQKEIVKENPEVIPEEKPIKLRTRIP